MQKGSYKQRLIAYLVFYTLLEVFETCSGLIYFLWLKFPRGSYGSYLLRIAENKNELGLNSGTSKGVTRHMTIV